MDAVTRSRRSLKGGWSRRDFLKLTAGLALASALPWPKEGHAGLLDPLFGEPARETPPITPNDQFYVTSYRSPPTIRVNQWRLMIRGLVSEPKTLTYEELLARPTAAQTVTLECIGNAVGDEYISTARWEGVPLNALLEEAGVDPQAFDVVVRGADEYSDSIPVSRAREGDVLVAHHMNGVPLPEGHGFPARLIVPGHYGMKSVQWLTDIELVAHDYKGYYQKKGWSEQAIVKTMSRIDLPVHGDRVPGKDYTIRGLAFAGLRGIQRVEVSTDGGHVWEPARLDPPLSPAAWVFWSYPWRVRKSGYHELTVRATDGSGTLQTDFEQGPAPDGASGLHRITVKVEA